MCDMLPLIAQYTDSSIVSHDVPDPELLVRFGDVDGLLGYMPWQIRVTEITCVEHILHPCGLSPPIAARWPPTWA